MALPPRGYGPNLYAFASQFDSSYKDAAQRLTVPEVQTVAGAYSLNMERIRALAALPTNLVFRSSTLGRVGALAAVRMGIDPDGTGHMEDPEYVKACSEEFRKWKERWRTDIPKEDDEKARWSFGGQMLAGLMQQEPRILAFGSTAEAVFKRHPHVPYHEAMRHLFAHKGGVIDDQFMTRSKSHFPEAKLEKGYILGLTGLQVRMNIDYAVAFALDILEFADGQITRALSK